MVAGFKALHEWPVNYHIYCIYYITKIFLSQRVAVVLESFFKVVASPNPNTCVGQDFLNPLTQIYNTVDVRVCQRFSAEYREVAMDAIFLQARNDFVDDVFGEISADIEALQLWVVTPRAMNWATGDEHRGSYSGAIGQVIVDYFCYLQDNFTSIPFVCLVRLRTSACLPALKARR